MTNQHTLETSFACGHAEVTKIEEKREEKRGDFANRKLWSQIFNWTGGQKPNPTIADTIRRSFAKCPRCEVIEQQVQDFELRRDWIAIDAAEPLNRDGSKLVQRAAPAARGTAETLEAVSVGSSAAAEEAARKLRGVMKGASKSRGLGSWLSTRKNTGLTTDLFESGQAPRDHSDELLYDSETRLERSGASNADISGWVATSGGVDVPMLMRLARRADPFMEPEPLVLEIRPEVVRLLDPPSQTIIEEAEPESSEAEEELVIPYARIIAKYPLTLDEHLWTPGAIWGPREGDKVWGVTLWTPASRLAPREASTTIWNYLIGEQVEQVESFPPESTLWQPSVHQVSSNPQDEFDNFED